MEHNPFRQPFASSKMVYKTTAWPANERGKNDSTSRVLLASDGTHIWLGKELSVPLEWIISAEALGPGFLLVWDNPIERQQERAAFCYRTMFGHDTRKRDEAVQRISDLLAPIRVKRANDEIRPGPLPPVGFDAEGEPAAASPCEVCGEQDARAYDLTSVISALFYYASHTRRTMMCARHGKIRVVLNTFGNMALGNFGITALITPFVIIKNVVHAKRRGAIGTALAVGLCMAGFYHVILLGLLILYGMSRQD